MPFYHRAYVVPAQSRAPLPVSSATVCFDVRALVGDPLRYLLTAVPSASYWHKGDGWTRICASAREEATLMAHLREFHPLTCKKVA